MKQANRIHLALGLCLAAVAFCYARVLPAPFLFDDHQSIVRNAALRSIRFLGDLWPYAPTRFVTFLTFLLNYQLTGLETWSYHLINLLLHLTTSILVFHLARQILDFAESSAAKPSNDTLAFWIAVVFAAHPIQTETVSYIWGRSAGLTALFYVSALLAYCKCVRAHSMRGRAAVLSLTLLAMFSKQIAFTLPFIICLFEAILIGKRHPWVHNRARRLWPVLATIVVIPMTMLLFGDNDWKEINASFSTAIYVPPKSTYFFTQWNVLRDYYRLLLFPLHQNVDYHVPWVTSPFQWDAVLSLVFHLTVVALAFRVKRILPAFTFGMLFFYVALGVESSFVALADAQFEHRLYLPSFGFFLAGATALRAASNRWLPAFQLQPRWVSAATLLVLVTLLSLTWRRNHVWLSDEAFWADAAAKSPLKARTLVNRGRSLSRLQKFDEALPYYERAARLDPRNSMAQFSLVMYHANKDNFPKLLEALTKLSRIDPKLPETHYANATLSIKTGDMDGTYRSLRKAIEALNPNQKSPDEDFVAEKAPSLLLQLAFDANRFDDVIFAAQYILEQNPNRFDVRARLAHAFERKNRLDEAEAQYRLALETAPLDFSTLNNYATLLEKRGKAESAKQLYQHMVRNYPTENAPRINLVLLLASQKNRAEAETRYREIPELGNDGWQVYGLLGRTFSEGGFCDLAGDAFQKALQRVPSNEKAFRGHVKQTLARCKMTPTRVTSSVK